MTSHSAPQATSPLAMWLSYIEKIHNSAIDLGLDRVKTVATSLDLIKPAPFVITVAGTNGKGSTCAIMEAILLDAGYKVGVYSSPHLIDYKERVRINGQLLSDEDFSQAFNKIEQARGETSLSFFEFGTLAALQLSKQHKVDVLLLEVGLGGRLDATNIVDHDVSVITSLAIDHVDWLGDDIDVIGYEKAGIFRSLKPAICGQPFPPLSVEEHADDINAQLFQVGKDFDYQIIYHKDIASQAINYPMNGDVWCWQNKYMSLDNLPIPKLPLANAATALMALATSDLTISTTNIVNGLNKANLAGRMQVLSNDPIVLLDVAHNPHSAEYLAKYLRLHYPNKTIHAVVGMLKDKDIKQTLNKLEGVVDKWYPADLQGERAAKAEELITFILAGQSTKEFEPIIGYESPIQAFQAAEQCAHKNDVILVMGSFHTVGEIIDWRDHGICESESIN